MRPFYTRYPLFAAAREATESVDIATTALAAEDTLTAERDVERVEHAFMEGAVGPDPGEACPWEIETKLLSYPISCITILLIETPAAVDKCVRVEADASYERMFADFDAGDDDAHDGVCASLDDLLCEFNLDSAVRAEPSRSRNSRRAPDNYWVDVEPCLTYSDTDWSADWRLINHLLADDAVRVIREELLELLRETVHRRVARGSPFVVRGSDAGDWLADALKPHVERLRNLLSDRGAVNVAYIDAVGPDHSPPCIETLLARAWEDGPLSNEAVFALAMFFVGVGLGPDEVGSIVGDETAEVL